MNQESLLEHCLALQFEMNQLLAENDSLTEKHDEEFRKNLERKSRYKEKLETLKLVFFENTLIKAKYLRKELCLWSSGAFHADIQKKPVVVMGIEYDNVLALVASPAVERKSLWTFVTWIYKIITLLINSNFKN